jgi:ElaB/YqjD/DUF883 family membrane-anchored ribosome-binding protein
MSFLQDLRRLFFGAKAVTKNTAEKAGETIRETARDTREELDAWMERMRRESGVEPPEPPQVIPPSSEPERPDLLQRTGEQLRETGGDILHKAGEVAEKTGKVILDKGKKVEEAIEGLGEQVISAGEKLAEKAGEVAEKVGGEVLEKGGDILDKAREFLKETGHKAGEEFGKLYDKAQEEAARDAADKAARAAEQEAYTAKYRGESPQGKDHLDALDPSLLAGKDSFFEKADQFAKGNHHHGELHIEPGEKTERPRSDAPTAGFEDRDGDGDDIIDDAEIVQEDPPKA